MKAPTAEQRSAELGRAVVESRRRLDAALATLSRVSSARLTLGGRVAGRPWGWLAGACAAGLLIGMMDHPTD